MAARPCLDCGALTTRRARCPNCTRTHSQGRPRPPTSGHGYTWTERKRRAQTVTAWRETYGDICPGWQQPPHPATPTNPLTADHVHSVATTGRQDGPLTVLCRRCNAAKAARPYPG